MEQLNSEATASVFYAKCLRVLCNRLPGWACLMWYVTGYGWDSPHSSQMVSFSGPPTASWAISPNRLPLGRTSVFSFFFFSFFAFLFSFSHSFCSVLLGLLHNPQISMIKCTPNSQFLHLPVFLLFFLGEQHTSQWAPFCSLFLDFSYGNQKDIVQLASYLHCWEMIKFASLFTVSRKCHTDRILTSTGAQGWCQQVEKSKQFQFLEGFTRQHPIHCNLLRKHSTYQQRFQLCSFWNLWTRKHWIQVIFT